MDNYAQLIRIISFTILCYDHFLTFPAEVRLFWCHNNRACAPIIFYISRYAAILGHIPIVYATFALLDTDLCFKLQCYHQIFTSTSFALVSALLAMRTCVLYHRSRPIRWFLVIFYVTILGEAAGVTIKNIVPISLPPHKAAQSCSQFVVGHVPDYYYAAMWASTALFDCIIFFLIIRKTWTNRSRGLVRHSRFDLFLRDGSIYFGVLILLYLTDIFTFMFCSPYYKGLLVIFTEAMAYVLTGRIMLNIRAAGQASLGISSTAGDMESSEIEFGRGSYSDDAS